MLAAFRDVLDVAVLRVVHHRDLADVRRRELLVTCVPRGTEPPGTRWVGFDELPEVGARRLLEEATGPAAGPRQPWVHRDWLPAAERWLRAAAGRPATGPVEQRKVWDLSCVLRAPTDGGDVYLKTTVDSALFVDEVAVTLALARLFPGRVPEPVAAEPRAGWLALADFGTEVGWGAPVEVREEVVREFARLQLASVPVLGELRAAGCQDRGLSWLAGQVPSWFGTGPVGRLAPPDVAARLAAAVPRLVGLCAELGAHGLPDTLAHGDMHMGNVARGPRGYLFFDWTDAAVGHPFLDLIAVGQEESPVDRLRLRDAYLSEWHTVGPVDRLAALWPAVEVLSAANQAISYLSLGLSLRSDPVAAPSSLFGSYTVHWLETVVAALDQLDGTRSGRTG